MDEADNAETDAPLPVPLTRLTEVLGGWSGEGVLYDPLWSALAAVTADDTIPAVERAWTAADVTRRAHRVLLERLRPHLEQWPNQLRHWVEALPATTHATRATSARPLRPTNWQQTARRYGWPPTAFVGRRRSTQADELLLSALRWTLPQLVTTYRNADAVVSDVTRELRPQLETAQQLLREHFNDDDAPNPSGADLAAVARAGYPWNVLAPVSSAYLRYRQNLPDLAHDLIYPLDSLRWRLFHLGALGELIGALHDQGATLRWLAPLSAAGGVPQYRAELGAGVELEVWFEAAGVWRRHHSRTPYREALEALALNPSPIGPDILLLDVENRAALVLECKYGPARYVGRSGYLQALAYASELRVDLADDVWAYVVGPEGVVTGSSFTALHDGRAAQRIGVTSPAALGEVVAAFLGRNES